MIIISSYIIISVLKKYVFNLAINLYGNTGYSHFAYLIVAGIGQPNNRSLKYGKKSLIEIINFNRVLTPRVISIFCYTGKLLVESKWSW